MEIKGKARKTVEVVTDILCDCCGKTCRVNDLGGNPQYEYMKLNTSWGFGSKKDMEIWTAKVCESCVDKKLKKIIKFDIQNFNINGSKIIG